MQVQPVQQVQTSYYRTAYGWTGLSLIEMGNNLVLRIITEKRENQQRVLDNLQTILARVEQFYEREATQGA